MAIQQYNSDTRYSCPKTGLMLPWYTLGALEWLINQPINEWSVFEHGCGYSSCWYKSQAKRWDGVDSSNVWADAVDGYNWSVNEYFECFNTQNHDLYIVDGLEAERPEVLRFFLQKPFKYIIVDNWKQSSVEIDWGDCEDLIKRFKYEIHKEPNHADWQTLIIHND